jgi:hypothetical protein
VRVPVHCPPRAYTTHVVARYRPLRRRLATARNGPSAGAPLMARLGLEPEAPRFSGDRREARFGSRGTCKLGSSSPRVIGATPPDSLGYARVWDFDRCLKSQVPGPDANAATSHRDRRKSDDCLRALTALTHLHRQRSQTVAFDHRLKDLTRASGTFYRGVVVRAVTLQPGRNPGVSASRSSLQPKEGQCGTCCAGPLRGWSSAS